MLMIVFEFEVVFIYVKYLLIERYLSGFGMIKDGIRYMVVDIGGKIFIIKYYILVVKKG